MAGLKDEHPIPPVVDEAVLRNKDVDRKDIRLDLDVLSPLQRRAKGIFRGVEDVRADASHRFNADGDWGMEEINQFMNQAFKHSSNLSIYQSLNQSIN